MKNFLKRMKKRDKSGKEKGIVVELVKRQQR